MGIAWLGAYVKRHPDKKLLRHLSRFLWSLAVLGICFALLLSGLMLSAVAKTPPKTDEDVTVIVLGCQVYPDRVPSHSLVQRLNAAVQYLNEHPRVSVIVSGAQGDDEPCPEAEVMREMLIERGVPEEIIHLEDRSRITIENILNAKALLGEGKNIALVSSDYHVERALQDCARAGLIAYGVGAVTPEGPYRDEMYATEKRIAEEMAAYRAKGMTDQDITNSIVERMKKHGAVTKEELEKKGE
jgi:uncharacterized SAM-binding protein YcdF (DUF218 family)